MSLYRALIPAVAAAALIVGCDSKPKDNIPTTAPMAASEPHQILTHLKYMAVRKDMKHVPVIAPSDLTNLYGNAFWFHQLAGKLGVSLTEEEIQALGVKDLENLGYLAANISSKELNSGKLPQGAPVLDPTKLDELPNPLSPIKAVAKEGETVKGSFLRAAYYSGIYRLMKAVPTEMWSDIAVMEVKPNAGKPGASDVFLGFHGNAILQVTVDKKADNTFGIIYVYYKATPGSMKAMLKQAAGEK